MSLPDIRDRFPLGADDDAESVGFDLWAPMQDGDGFNTVMEPKRPDRSKQT